MLKRICIIIFGLLLLSSCSVEPNSTNNEIANVDEIVDEFAERRKEIDEYEPLPTKERLELDYANGAYLKDYSTVKERLNKEAEAYFVDFYASWNIDLEACFFDVDLLNTYYDKVEEQEISFEDIMNNHRDWIHFVNLKCFIFHDYGSDEEKKSDYLSNFLYANRDLMSTRISDEQMGLIIYDFDVKFQPLIKELYSKKESLLSILSAVLKENYSDFNYSLNENYWLYEYVINDDDKYMNEVQSYSNEAFGTDFFLVDRDNNSNKSLFAPVYNLNLKSELYGIRCPRFINVVVEDFMISKIQKKLDDMGVSDKIGLFVVSTEGPEALDDHSLLKNPIELQKMCENKVALYYVIGPNETYDYDMLHEVIVNIQDEIFIDESLTTLYVKLYKGNEEVQKTFLKLMREYALSENYIREDVFLYDNEISGNDSEPFKYLKYAAEKEDFMFLFVQKKFPPYPTDTWYSNHKMKDEFTRYDE